MKSVYVPSENIKGNIIEIIDKNDINHIIKVLRMNENDELRAVDGKYEYFCKIKSITKKSVELKIIDKFEDTYSLKRNVDIALALIKQDAFNLTIQKLTEIGVSNIIPIITEFTVVKLNEKKEKWEKIITESMKQCRAVKKTNILEPILLKNLDLSKYDKVIFVYEKSNNTKQIQEIVKKEDENILYIIGPEGGFSNTEKEYLCSKCEMISLGKRILRAETAAIYVMALLSYLEKMEE